MRHPKFNTSPETSKRMSHVHLKGGDAETALAKQLWNMGVRYRKNYKKLPGSPDIAIIKHRIAIFVDGEFWHGHDWSNKKDNIKTNRDYWIAKIEENIARDMKNDYLLFELGWFPIHFWEKEVKKDVGFCVGKILDIINNKSNNPQ